MSRFQQQGAQTYDGRIGTLVPGYIALHQTSAAWLKAVLPPDARVLVLGAGTGAEVLALAQQNPHWHITALEPSGDMLALARAKCAAAQRHNVAFVHGYTADLPAGAPFDAALCLLVMHFIDTTAGKQQFLNQAAAQLAAGAPLLLCDLMQGHDTERAAMVHYAIGQGLPESQGEALRRRLQTEFFALGEAELAALARQAGFRQPELYFRALGFAAFVLIKQFVNHSKQHK